MAADLHVHVMADGLTDADLDDFSGPWTAWNSDRKSELYDRIAATPDFHVCEVSWLKAAILGGGDDYVPGVADVVSDLCRDRPVLTPELVDQLVAAYGAENASIYAVEDRRAEFGAFLLGHIGERVFTISW